MPVHSMFPWHLRVNDYREQCGVMQSTLTSVFVSMRRPLGLAATNPGNCLVINKNKSSYALQAIVVDAAHHLHAELWPT